ncbi:MAG: DUF4177 domain-containing protein [Xanthomonadales bacterium]|nr:DUF4177 domain-containing protein [Xanthomonadaceae bacterium]MBN8223644.1 DUF4177 domain-containing protein [Xanthomonadales bacterium]MCA0198947.1 DUF4177 domain-containing protein [Pseudomonadota bacterium]HRF84038.1 DUF4177 domain-containing protein [Pseudoxanthomonas sp.]
MSTPFEYQVVEIKQATWGGFKPEAVQEVLAREGRKGWELVQLVAPSAVGPMLAVFKRAY